MKMLTTDQLRRVHALAAELRRGAGMTQHQMDRLADEWMPLVAPSEQHRSERFAVALPTGETTGVAGPRRLFHLFGLCHRSVHVALRTPSGLIVLQQRSRTKEESPGGLDMAVSGHVPQHEDGRDMSFEEAVWKECEEEIGLSRSSASWALAEGALTPLEAPYFCFVSHENQNPPFFDAEVRQIYHATITGDGLAQIRFTDSEAIAIVLLSRNAAWAALQDPAIASGMRYSLPRYLSRLEQTTPLDS